MKRTKYSFTSKGLLKKLVKIRDLTVGQVKEIIIDPAKFRITHLDVELSKEAAEEVFGVRKRRIRNLLATSAIDSVDKTINLKVTKKQLRIYLKVPRCPVL